MDCKDARPRITAHILGQDPSVGDHLAACAECAAEERSLRATLDLLDRYSRATAPARRRHRRWLVPLAAAAAIVVAVLMHRPASDVTVVGEGPYLVANGGPWRFMQGRTVLRGDVRLATLPGAPVEIGGKARLEGGSRACVSAGGEIRLEEGTAIVSGREVRAHVPEDAEVPPVVAITVAPGVPAEPELERYLTGADGALKRVALRMAVVLELRSLLPLIRRAAVGDAAPEVRCAALYAVWRLDPDRAFLRERAERDPDGRVRESACQSLGLSATEADVEFLRRAAEDPATRSGAVLALGYMARRGVPIPKEVDARVRELFEGRQVEGRDRYACLRYLQDREILSAEAARAILFDRGEDARNRRMASATLLGLDRDAALEDARRLFAPGDESSRVIAIDLLCHYGTMDDARRVAALLETGTPAEQARVFYALGLRANFELDPPVPLRPSAEEADAVRRRLLEWVRK